MLSTLKILAAQNDPNALDAYLCNMAPKMTKKKMEELLESTKKEGISHVTTNVVKEFSNKNIPEAIPLATVSVAFAPTSKAPTNPIPNLWAKHLREFNEGPEDSLWNLSIDRSEIVDGHIMRRADEAKFARAGDIANLEKELAAEKDNLATAYSKLKKEKNDLAAKDGFENAISQIRIIAPNVDVSKVNMYKVVRNGMIVDEEEDEET
ncbi:hypothetical protein QL285_043020 [Trifolium repens]|nr:hypothetical protein QL285_043020 [Trifolium repens]